MTDGFEHFRNLPITEKQSPMEEQSEDIATSSGSFPISDAILAEAERRAKELDENPSLAITREELWRRVDELRGKPT